MASSSSSPPREPARESAPAPALEPPEPPVPAPPAEPAPVPVGLPAPQRAAEAAALPPAVPAPKWVMPSVSNLAQLLPTGTVLAYEALSPTFTNHGNCNIANKVLTGVMILVLAIMCVFFSFTDSIVGSHDGKLYYGVATWHGFNVFNFSDDQERQEWTVLDFKKLRLRWLDIVQAIFTAVVFLTVAFSDVGLQNCFFPKPGGNTQQVLKILPLGMAIVSSFVFTIFPTKRKGIGFNDITPRQTASQSNAV
ncbi:protein DMP10-like [Triticum urartu]|uniref:protein DMP10-like n=1 Tax=Triticum urartu TaxID=4572 RepID=UPI00204401D1|nr:protein DMP10-like [Triticum urartu]